MTQRELKKQKSALLGEIILAARNAEIYERVDDPTRKVLIRRSGAVTFDDFPETNSIANQLQADITHLAGLHLEPDEKQPLSRWLDAVAEHKRSESRPNVFAELSARWEKLSRTKPQADLVDPVVCQRRWRAVAPLAFCVVVAVAVFLWMHSSESKATLTCDDHEQTAGDHQLLIFAEEVIWDLHAINQRLMYFDTGRRRVESHQLQLLVARASGNAPVRLRLDAAVDDEVTVLTIRAEGGTLKGRWADGALTGPLQLTLKGLSPLTLILAGSDRLIRKVILARRCWDRPPWPAVSLDTGQFVTESR